MTVPDPSRGEPTEAPPSDAATEAEVDPAAGEPGPVEDASGPGVDAAGAEGDAEAADDGGATPARRAEAEGGAEQAADSGAMPAQAGAGAEAGAEAAADGAAAPAQGAEAKAEGSAEQATDGGATPAQAGAGAEGHAEAAGDGEAAPAQAAEAEGEADGGTEAAQAGAGAEEAGDGAASPARSEAEAELAAQREERARIERRKAERDGPPESGAKLSGKAADLLAAVRAVEAGEKSGTTFYETPAPAPRPSAPAPVRPRQPEAVPAPRVAAPETLTAVREVLAAGGAPEALADKVAALLGEGAAEVLREDPWQLLAVPGVQPDHADGFARALLGGAAGPGDPRRATALVGWLLERAAVQGHTALELSAVCAALAERAVPDPEEAVRQAVAEGAVLVFQEEEEAEEAEAEAEETQDGAAAAPPAQDSGPPVPLLLGLDRYALAEESLADGLARLAKTVTPADWDGTELARACGAHGLVTHTGGEAARAEPLALVRAARERGLRAALAVHTENGRRRLGADAGVVTVADLLSGAAGPDRDEDGALALDLLAVLDAPQLDVETAAMLVEALPDGCRLLLSGDPGVLGAAGAGRVFGDVLAARVCPQVASRTPDPGPLGELVSGIGIGELTQVEAPGKEVVIVPVRDAGEAVHRTVQLVADSVPRAIGIPAGQTQVITVGHGGAAGTRALNAALKQRLNPGPGRFGGFDPGDRVAHSPVPGRTVTGTVVSADAEGLHLDRDGEKVVVPKDRVEASVRHGWALTAHQAAGMRWPAVVAVLPGDAARGLSRAWVYTAFGRAERHLSVVHGVDQALPRAVAEGLAPARTTRLRPLLEALLATPEDD